MIFCLKVVLMVDQSSANKKYFVQALERAINILDCFSAQSQELSLSQVTERTGLHRTTVTRILNHLADRHILRFDRETKRYHLGSKIVELGGIALSSLSLRKVSGSYISGLRDEIGYTVLLASVTGDHYVFIDKQEGRSLISLSSDIGWRRPLSFGLFGMVFLAFLPLEHQKRILDEYPLKPYTASSIVDKKRFIKELKRIKDQGYCIEKELFHEDLGGICAPIKDYTGSVVACLGTAINAAKLNAGNDNRELVEKVMKAAGEISIQLGFTGD